MTSTVFITGATGFIAHHIVQHLLDNNYNVVGSVRSESKGESLAKNFNNSNFHYVVISNLGVKGAFDETFAKYPDIKHILHTASPVDLSSKDLENEIVTTAVDNAVNILYASKEKLNHLERFVFTSSIAAVAPVYDPAKLFSKPQWNQDDWNDITIKEAKLNSWNAYFASKTFAEQKVWEFSRTENPSFAISSVNPTYVFGPQVFEEDVRNINVTNRIIQELIDSKYGDDRDFASEYKNYVSVNDVAKLHLAAFELENTKGKRLIAAAGPTTDQLILNVINDRFPTLKGKAAVGSPDKNSPGPFGVDTSQTVQLTGIKFESLESVISDVTKQILDYRKNFSSS